MAHENGYGQGGYVDVFFMKINPHEAMGSLEGRFIQLHMEQLGHEWTLRDPQGNTHVVRFNRSEINPLLTTGWSNFLDHYGILDTHWGVFFFRGESSFDIALLNKYLDEIPYPIAPPVLPVEVVGDAVADVAIGNHVIQPEDPIVHDFFPLPPQTRGVHLLQGPDSMYQWSYTICLTQYGANSTQLSLPRSVGDFLRGWGINPWSFRGPTGVIVSVKVLAGPRWIKFGSGWRTFCDIHALCEGDILTFKFTDGVLRVVDVIVVEGGRM